jgi:hypothetical protein
MVLHRVDCGLPRFCGFLTQAARSQHGSLFIGILASLRNVYDNSSAS